MNSSDGTQRKQQVAVGRNREAALRVIMPRLMGALKHEGQVVRDENGTQLIAAKGEFCIRLQPGPHDALVQVWHRPTRMYHAVFSARMYSDGSGTSLDRRLYVIGWDRSAASRRWQAELFETFAQDSDWLLNLPEKVVRPEIVTEVLSHIASLSVRSV